MKNGKGKEYYLDGKLIFEGEYLNGKELIGTKYVINDNKSYPIDNTIGKGKEYDNYGHLEFEGEYLNGKKWNGKEIEYEHFEPVCEYEYRDGEKINRKYY